MNTIDNDAVINFEHVTHTFTADYWFPTFSDTKEVVRKTRIEKILSMLDDKERT